MKKRLTQSEEFEIMKLVLDKFLWLGFAIMAFGLYQAFTASVQTGFAWIVAGAVVLILFMVLIVREYEIIA
ncbi:hypothetical protein AUJ68_05160 [Candidatus Woesearchaeota archaeon CG1_02_57_44]|nr:MAG: hypothetical protein AUJ68_05160 [Candidatus Woesearchaeota archaeon CG1_02_57_44]